MPATSQTLVNNAVLAATLQHRNKGYIDQVQKQMPLLFWLRRKGRYKPAEGERIEWSVQYELNQEDGSYQGLDLFTLLERDDATVLFASWKNYQKPIIISGVDKDVKNKGPKIFDLLEQKEENALASMQEDLNESFYLDGTANSSKNVTGLAAIVADDPSTGTIFGINRATAGNEWARNRFLDSAGVAAYTASAPVNYTMRRAMNTLYTECGRGKVGGTANRYPDLGLCTEGYYNTYDDMLNQGQRFTNVMVADAGFTNVKFKGMTMIEDEDCPVDSATEGRCYFLNSKFLMLFYAPVYNFKTTDAQRVINQNAFVAHLFWSGELTCQNFTKQGTHKGILDV